MIHAICVAGARPNLIKIKPVIDGLESLGAKTTFVHTGQHYDEAMSGVFLTDLGLRQPDRWLGVGSGMHAEQTARVMVAFEPVVDELCPDVVVVVGDVNSTLGCALVGAKAGAMVAHVEAGLRSRDWSMPEVVNRVVTDRVSDGLFAPSADAITSLQAKGCCSNQIHLMVNVMVDSLLALCQCLPGRRQNPRSWNADCVHCCGCLAIGYPRAHADLHRGHLPRRHQYCHDQALHIRASAGNCSSRTRVLAIDAEWSKQHTPCRCGICLVDHRSKIWPWSDWCAGHRAHPLRHRTGLVVATYPTPPLVQKRSLRRWRSGAL